MHSFRFDTDENGMPLTPVIDGKQMSGVTNAVIYITPTEMRIVLTIMSTAVILEGKVKDGNLVCISKEKDEPTHKAQKVPEPQGSD